MKLAASSVMSCDDVCSPKQYLIRVENAKANANGSSRKPKRLKLIDAGARGIDKLRTQDAVQQLRQHTATSLDELGVNIRNVYLPEIHIGTRMSLEPAADIEQPAPYFGEFKRTQRPFSEPRDQARFPRVRDIQQRGEAGGFSLLADKGRRVLERIEPYGIGQCVGTKYTMS